MEGCKESLFQFKRLALWTRSAIILRDKEQTFGLRYTIVPLQQQQQAYLHVRVNHELPRNVIGLTLSDSVAMQDSEDYCFQLIEEGVAFPPILVKAEIQGTVPHGTPSSSQGSTKSFLRLQAIRFLNGKQEIVQRDLGGEDDSDAFVKAVSGKKGLNRHMSNQECCREVYDRFKATKFKFDFDKRDHTVKVRRWTPKRGSTRPLEAS